MLPDILIQYLNDVDAAIRELDDIYVERYEEEHLTSNRVNLKVRVRFTSGHLLELNESVIVEARNIKHLGYRYHFQDKENKLVFRYDNTPHFPDLDSFPHHKHSMGEVIASDKPSIPMIIQEIKLLDLQAD
jgi:hypothetical protein